MWGKRKLAVLLRRQGQAISAAEVGRILKKLIDKGRVAPVPFCAASRAEGAFPSTPMSATPSACPRV